MEKNHDRSAVRHLPDYLITDLNIPMCSGKMKNIIERNCKNSNDIHWLPVDVRNGSTITEYYIIHVPHYIPDVIDLDKSDRDKDVIFSPHFRQELIEDKDIFASEDDITTIYFSQRLKDILDNGKRSDRDFLILWDMLKAFNTDCYYTDNWGGIFKIYSTGKGTESGRIIHEKLSVKSEFQDASETIKQKNHLFFKE